MVRAVIGVIVGYAVWSAAWLAGGMLLFAAAGAQAAEGQRIDDTGTLLGLLALSVACSLAAGAACGAIARARAWPASGVMGGLLLATGIAVQASSWSLMPAWYHITFLALIVPAVLAGAMLTRRGLKRG